MQFQFVELHGELRSGGIASAGSSGLVVLSDLDRGAAESGARDQVSLKYVSEGTEIYRYGGKTYAVTAGQFLAVPARHAGVVEISRSSGERARGMCLTLDASTIGRGGLEAPMLFPARCSALGRMLSASHARMVGNPHQRGRAALQLMERVHEVFEPLLEETFGQLAGLDKVRASTRYELLRKLNVARSYLHSVDHRAVSLSEVAGEAGISQFHLLRNFRSCFGESPSAYHRRIRLEAAKRTIDRQDMSCGEAAHRYGFADASSFSHAYRRAFGRAPLRTKQPKPNLSRGT